MYKLILMDFRSHFKSSLRYLYHNSPLFFIWLLSCSLSISDQDNRELSYIFMVFPCIFAYTIARMYCGYSSKTFLLCPLDTSMRLKYAAKSFRLRVLIPAIFFFTGNIILMLCGYFYIDIFLLRSLVFLCTAISVNIYCHPEHSKDALCTNRYPFTGNFEITNINSHIACLLMIIVTTHTTEHRIADFNNHSLEVVLILLIFQISMTVYKTKKYYWQSLAVVNLYK